MWLIDRIVIATVIAYLLVKEYISFIYRFVVIEEICLENGYCSLADKSSFCRFLGESKCKRDIVVFIYFIFGNWICLRSLVYIWNYKKIQILTAEIVNSETDTETEL